MRQDKRKALDFELLFRAIPGLYLVLLPDSDFTIAGANTHFLTMIGGRKSDITGCGLFELFHADSIEFNQHELADLRNALHWVLKNKNEYLMLLKYYDSNTVNNAEELITKYWEVTITPVCRRNESVKYIMLKLSDAAAMVRSKEREEAQMLRMRALEEVKRENMRKIKESNVQLEILNRNLKTAIAELELANDELDSFCYSVSHDLHAPIRVISGYIKILLEDHTARLNGDARKMAARVYDNALLMCRQIDDLLAFSRMGKSSLVLTSVNMNEIAGNAIEAALNEKSKYERPRIVLEKLLPVRADYNLLGHVFTNLITNAVKFASKSRSPEIEIKSVRRKGRIVYSIKDNGVGFDMKYSDKLFGIFQRLHSSEEYEGTGLGLALVKRIVIRHGGEVWAKATPGKGATFSFSMPSDD